MKTSGKSTLILKSLAWSVLCAGLAACAGSPPVSAPVKPAQVNPTPVITPETRVRPPARVTPLAQQPVATSPWDYISQSQQTTGNTRYGLMLDAIEGFLDLNQAATARTLLEQLETEPLAGELVIRKQILLARSHFLAAQYRQVERVLRPLTSRQGLSRQDASQILMIRARAIAALGNPEASLRLLTAREPLLASRAEVEENQQVIWRMLALLNQQRLESLRIDATEPTLAQWADLALISQRASWSPHSLRLQLEQWRQLHPAHPASTSLIPVTLEQLGSSITEYSKVALLLPLTSGFGNAARAVYDGFVMMNEADTNPLKPQVVVYDTGENPELISFYYQAAVREGAELVVGPLGKTAVDALAGNTDIAIPTLLLGNTDVPLTGRRNVFQFGLSPENEARELARKIFSEGHRVGAILYPETDWGLRQQSAFTEQWQALGGQVAENSVYIAERQDHSQAIKLMLNIDESDTRKRRIQRLSEEKLLFEPRRRQDLDFIFLIARSHHGRLLKPQINFHAGKTIPVYGISQVYSGDRDKVKDLDLDGVVFGDMPWLLLDSGVYRNIRENLPQGNNYHNRSLDRLFALGIDAYQLLFRLEQMKSNPVLSFQGATGQLSLAADGHVLRRLEWARFDGGLPTPVAWDAVLPDTETPGTE